MIDRMAFHCILKLDGLMTLALCFLHMIKAMYTNLAAKTNLAIKLDDLCCFVLEMFDHLFCH